MPSGDRVITIPGVKDAGAVRNRNNPFDDLVDFTDDETAVAVQQAAERAKKPMDVTVPEWEPDYETSGKPGAIRKLFVEANTPGTEAFASANYIDNSIEQTYYDKMVNGEGSTPELMNQLMSLIKRTVFPKQPSFLSDTPTADALKRFNNGDFSALASNGTRDAPIWVIDSLGQVVHGVGWERANQEYLNTVQLQRDSFIQEAELFRNEQLGNAKRAAALVDKKTDESGLDRRNQASIDSAEKIAEAQLGAQKAHWAEMDKLAKEQHDYTVKRDNADRAQAKAIHDGDLAEVVRNNKAKNAAEDRLNDIKEQQAKQEFLGSMLANGGLMFFTLALMDSGAAADLFHQLTGGTADMMGGPIGAATQFNQRYGSPGSGVPSVQQLAQMSPIERVQTQTGFQGMGRDVNAEAQNLAPATPGGYRLPGTSLRRRAKR